jgi:hypothetical protein
MRKNVFSYPVALVVSAILLLTGCAPQTVPTVEGLSDFPLTVGVLKDVEEDTTLDLMTFTVEVADSAATEQAVKVLTDDGWEEISRTEFTDFTQVFLQKDSRAATLLLEEKQGQPQVVYQISTVDPLP